MKKFTKTLSVITAISVLLQSLFPFKTLASVTGPTQPEFSNFEPVSTDNMVNPFTGDFTYNIPIVQIPGTNGSGYSLSLSYHSGVGAEEEASWVGSGWTLNPGAIVRGKQGFADDVDKGTITQYNKMKTNWTVTAGTNGSIGIRAFGLAVSAGLNSTIGFSNYHGLFTSTVPYVGYQLGTKATTISLEDEGEIRYSYSYSSPLSVIIDIVQSAMQLQSQINFLKTGVINKQPQTIQNAMIGQGCKMASGESISSSRYGAYTLHNQSIPTSAMKYASSEAFQISLGGYYAPSPLPIGLGASVFGTFNSQVTYGADGLESNYYGYLYSHNATKDDMMDYTNERNDNYNVKDEFLSTPFSSPDNFNVVGEGLGGVIRAYSSKIGEFHPKEVTNVTEIGSVGVHVNAGLNESASVSSSDGSANTLTIGLWDDEGKNDAYDFSNDDPESYFFRFIGDMGGHISMSSSDYPEAADLTIDNSGEGYVPELSSNYRENINTTGAAAVGRSSYIGYHTNEEMNIHDDYYGGYYKRYSHRADIEDMVDRSSTDRIGEFAITNKNGQHYVFALPVNAKKENNISVSVTDEDTVGNYLAYRDISSFSDNDSKIGQTVNSKYASMYLLTEITQPNYIDRTMDGPSSDDFGGWTKFNYTKYFGDKGDNTNWFHWRSPWKGLIYSPNQVSNPDDDMGTYSSGDKEICYLSSIETASYIAVFEVSSRKDGLEAESDEIAAKTSSTSSMDLTDNKKLKKLDKITLYAKDNNGDPGQVIKRIYFDYDYSLAKGQPNTVGTGSSNGKLTLKKVWFEYGDVRNAGISPFLFYYSYPKTTGSNKLDYPTKYDALDNYGTGLTQNPDYNEASIDGWGNYQTNGQTRARNLQEWNDQTPSSDYDPAAWNLKRIVMPSGGEINVQYEQKDYSFVQDRRAMAMVSLEKIEASASFTDESGVGNYGTSYYLNLDEIGANNSTDKKAIIDWIEKIFIDGYGGRDPEKMYFKFLYDVKAECGNEYITGYANVMSVDTSADGKLYVQLGNPSTDEYNTDGGFSSPCDACQEYFKAYKGLQIGQDCGEEAISESDDKESTVLQMIDLLAGGYSDLDASSTCQQMDVESSYLRIPVPSAKKGGGPRVKRLLRYTSGIEKNNADAALYGNEYVYETLDGESSGVATNEPNSFREENALIGYLKKRSESTKDEVLVSGEDKSQFEGPIGEFVLPSPSIGYSRIITKNIHDGATNNGYTSSEYYTAKDYPFDRTTTDGYSGISYTDVDKKVDNPDPSFGLLSNKTYYSCWATQGYKFIINNMHGQLKKQTVYDGDYDSVNSPDQATELASTAYNYFEPGELLPVMYSHYSFGSSALGKEVEVITESKQVTETSISTVETIDAGIGIWGVYTIPYAFPTFYKTTDETYLHTYTINKKIFCPAVVKSVTQYKDGTYSTAENKYFDPVSGDPVVIEKSGLFDQQKLTGDVAHEGKYISFNYPASAYYKYTGQKAGCEKLKIESGSDGIDLTFTNGGLGKEYSDPSYLTFEGSYCDVLDKLTPGDLVCITSGAAYPSIANIKSIEGNKVYVIPTSNFSLYGMGNGECDLEILQSNRANLLTLGVGNTVMYGSFEEPDGLISDNDQDNRNALAEYLTESLDGSSPAKPDELAYIAVINPENGNCVQCEEYDQSADADINIQEGLKDILDNMIGADDFVIDDYQSIIDWASESEMQSDYLFDFMDEIQDYIDMAATDNCIICDNREEFLGADNLFDVLATSYYEWQQDYYFNGISVNNYLKGVISTQTLFKSSFITNSSFYSTVKNLNTVNINNNIYLRH